MIGRKTEGAVEIVMAVPLQILWWGAVAGNIQSHLAQILDDNAQVHTGTLCSPMAEQIPDGLEGGALTEQMQGIGMPRAMDCGERKPYPLTTPLLAQGLEPRLESVFVRDIHLTYLTNGHDRL
jgi:hypothetical protein